MKCRECFNDIDFNYEDWGECRNCGLDICESCQDKHWNSHKF